MIDVTIDHKNIEHFSTMKTLTCRQARWSEYLSEFNSVRILDSRAHSLCNQTLRL